MGYYPYGSSSDGSLKTIIVLIILIFLIMFGHNACTATVWNNGFCPNCETRYELRAASKYSKYYACPDCGFEVKRY